jgi:hypothetical protein
MGEDERVSEAELREAVEWITDRSPDWDERNMLAVQRLNRGIAELVRLRAEVERLRDADAVLTRWGKLRAEYAALRGRQDHAPTHEEAVAAWARMDELEAEIELAFLAVRLASDARGVLRG